MLILLIPQIETLVLFVFVLRLHVAVLVGFSSNKSAFWTSQKIQDLAEAGAGQETGHCIPYKLTMT